VIKGFKEISHKKINKYFECRKDSNIKKWEKRAQLELLR